MLIWDVYVRKINEEHPMVRFPSSRSEIRKVDSISWLSSSTLLHGATMFPILENPIWMSHEVGMEMEYFSCLVFTGKG